MFSQLHEREQDTENTLGTGKLLGFFFLLVILSGVSFVLGYTFGRNAGSASASVKAPPAVAAAVAVATPRPDCARNPEACAPASPPPIAVAQPSAALSVRPADPVRSTPAPAPPAGSYVVQVAAISKQQDAQALSAALRRKQYPVFIAQPAGDSLFHVQVGPFAERKEADATRLHLIGDGYTPIVK